MGAHDPATGANSAIEHEVVDANCGALIEVGPDEAGAFARTLCLLLDQPDLRQRMGDAGRKRIEAE
jgi:glycosyltransferase involved in cell wall biosynthesis